MTTPTRLKTSITAGNFIVAPGVFDMFSAKIADRIGFSALYMTGYGVSGSHLGVADAGLVTYRDMVERARTIAEGTRTPLIADADTGFGGLLNIRHTVRGYEAAGVQAIQIEDQETPKKCGHTPNRRVIPARDMCRKIEVAVDARILPDTLIIARTDSRTGLGLDEAIRRGQDYAKAGADIVFVEAPESEDEFKRVGDEVDCWLLANMVPTGKSPVVPADTLKAYGFQIAIYPSAGMSVVCAALDANYHYLKSHGSTADSPTPAYTMAQLHDLTGFPEVWAFEKRFAEN
jgi:2-methylisocitrate lyase-like PEP mutase family enzyme